jgi:uncharacterized membrane protein YgcG
MIFNRKKKPVASPVTRGQTTDGSYNSSQPYSPIIDSDTSYSSWPSSDTTTSDTSSSYTSDPAPVSDSPSFGGGDTSGGGSSSDW